MTYYIEKAINDEDCGFKVVELVKEIEIDETESALDVFADSMSELDRDSDYVLSNDEVYIGYYNPREGVVGF